MSKIIQTELEYEKHDLESMMKAIKSKFGYMARFDTQSKVLEQLGMDLENLPQDMWDKFLSTRNIDSYADRILQSEGYKPKPVKVKVCVKDVVGTSNYKYKNIPLIESYYRLKRMSDHSSLPDPKSMLNKDDEALYTMYASGECIVERGNNRTIALKVAYLAELSKAQSEEEIKQIEEKYTYEVLVNAAPFDKEVREQVLFLLVDGYHVKSNCDTAEDCKYTITKKDEHIDVESKEDLLKLFERNYSIKNVKSYSELVKKLDRQLTSYAEDVFQTKIFPDYEERLAVINNMLPGFNEFFEKTVFFNIRNKGYLFESYNWLEDLIKDTGLDLENLSYDEIEQALVSIVPKVQQKEKEVSGKNFLAALEDSDDLDEIKKMFQSTNLDGISPEFSKFGRVGRYLEDEEVSFKNITNLEEKTKEMGKIIIESRKTRVRKNNEEIKLLDAEKAKLLEESFLVENRDIIEQLYSDLDEVKSEIKTLQEEYDNDLHNLENVSSSKKELEDKLASLESMSIFGRLFKSKEIKALKQDIEKLSSRQKKAEHLENNSKKCLEEAEKELKSIEDQIRDVCGYRLTRYEIEQILISGITLEVLDRKIKEVEAKSMELRVKNGKDMEAIEDIAGLIGIKDIGQPERSEKEQGITDD